MRDIGNQMKMDLELKGFSPKTRDAYIVHAKRFVKHFMKSPIDMGEAEIKEYLYYLISERNLSSSYINTAYSALKFLYETTLKRQWDMKSIPRTKKAKRLPIVLSKDEVKRIINVTTNLKHKTILATIYATGLRVKQLLGHSNVKTTSIYIHLTNHQALKLESTLDSLIG